MMTMGTVFLCIAVSSNQVWVKFVISLGRMGCYAWSVFLTPVPLLIRCKERFRPIARKNCSLAVAEIMAAMASSDSTAVTLCLTEF
jgi:hypothetical protein